MLIGKGVKNSRQVFHCNKYKRLCVESFDAWDWTQDRIEENRTVNRIRQKVGLWRNGGYPSVTATTARLLRSWTDPDRERKLFFCQVEALETIIYIRRRGGGPTWFLVVSSAKRLETRSDPGRRGHNYESLRNPE